MPNMTTSENNPWLYSLSLENNSHIVTFNTINKFLDKNIRAEITVNAGEINKPTFNGGRLGTYFDEAGDANSYSISIQPIVTNTKGFVSVHDSNSPILGNTTYYTIKSGEGEANTASVELYTIDGSQAGTNISDIVGTVSDSEPNTSGSYYLAFTGSGSSKIKTAGWFEAGTTLTAASKTRYFPITAAVGTVTKTSGSVSPTASLDKSSTLTWSDTNTSGISVTAKGNATASFVAQANITTAGYVPAANNKWTSGTLSIPKAASDATAIKYLTAVQINSGNSFGVTNNGGTTTVTSSSTSAGTVTIKAKKTANDSSNTTANIITNGLWQQATIKSPDTTASLGDPTYISDTNNANYNKFTITASGTIAKPTVNPAGYVNGNDTIGTRQPGTISGTKVLNKITVGTTISSGTSGTVTPKIKRSPKPSDDTWTDAASGAVTTTKPTSGVYVRVDADAEAKTIGVKGTVTGDGYGTTSQYAQEEEQSITAGSAAATSAYVPITTTSVTFTAGTLNNKTATLKTKTNIVTNESNNNSGISIVLQGTAGSTAATYTNNAGWLSAHSGTSTGTAISKTTWDGTTYYVDSVTVPSGKTFGVTNNGTTNITNSGTTNVTSGSTSAGVVQIKAKVASGDSSTTNQNVVSNGLWVNNTVGTTTNSVYTTKYGRTVVYYGTASSNHTISTNSFVTTSGASSSSYDFYITPRHTISKAGYLAAVTNSNGTAVYYKVTRTSIDQTHKTTVNSSNVASRAIADWASGWLAAGSIGAATFAASKDSNKAETDYVDISDTSEAPVLSSGGYLYINRGYTDDLKISLSKLVPDTISGKTMAPANYILTGYAAFDGTGAAINGTMQKYDGAYTVSTQ